MSLATIGAHVVIRDGHSCAGRRGVVVERAYDVGDPDSWTTYWVRLDDMLEDQEPLVVEHLDVRVLTLVDLIGELSE